MAPRPRPTPSREPSTREFCQLRGSTLESALGALRKEVSVEIADTPAMFQEIRQLRYQVCGTAPALRDGPTGCETDEYDHAARHVAIRLPEHGMMIGAVRLVLPQTSATVNDFPIQQVCDSRLLSRLPLATTGEISRFAIRKVRPRQVPNSSAAVIALLRLALIQGAVRLSANAGVTHWLTLLDPTLMRLLQATGLHFQPLGPPVECHGLLQPAVAELLPTLVRLRIEHPLMWNFMTQAGAWYSTSAARTGA